MGVNYRTRTSWQRETQPTVLAVAENGGLKKGAYVKVERRGAKLTGYCSADGKKWSPMRRPAAFEDEDRIEGEVKVGVGLFTRSAEGNKVTFDRFRLTPLKQE